ncbi:unnamed protein product [Agarophyton chilense]|eukprot:gb/GEZJ01003205.1/.p1 GENE.gb/GEZJ01003205.1/~~gb/GEZJ01003205.1/.p1  ORF type:complete len:369 (+),score=69.16 gb/GEZJ01003205.1/:112-1218(+)
MKDVHAFLQQVSADFEKHPPYNPKYQEVIEIHRLDENHLPVDNQIQTALEELRCLKYQLTALSGKEIFLRKLRDARSIEDLPSAQDAVAAEITIQKKKSALRKQKAARAAAETRFEKAIKDTCFVEKELQNARQLAQNHFKRIKSTNYTNRLAEKIREGDWESVVRSFDDITEVDKLEGSHCGELSAILTQERLKLETQANEGNTEVTDIQKRLHRVEQNIQMWTSDIQSVRRSLAEQERRDRNYGALLHEYELQNQFSQILPSITGVRITEARTNSISFEINGALFLPSDAKVDRSQVTHTLVIKRAEREGRAHMELSLSPADVEVSDLVDGQKNIMLSVVVKEVCARILKFLENRQQESTAWGGGR